MTPDIGVPVPASVNSLVEHPPWLFNASRPRRTQSAWALRLLFGVLCALMALALRPSPRILKIIVVVVLCMAFFTVYRIGQSNSATPQRQTRETLSVRGESPVRALATLFWNVL